MIIRSTAEAIAALVSCLALGHGLEYLASTGLLGLDRVPLGPGSGADAMAATPSPFGEHGWLPVPLGVLDLLLLFGAAGRWRADSWWSGCIGAWWGQLPAFAVCTFGILPSLLSAWLLWMPHICLPLPITLAVASASLSFSSLLFWSDLMPLLPRAHAATPPPSPPHLILFPRGRLTALSLHACVRATTGARATDECRRHSTRTSLLNLLHVLHFLLSTLTYNGRTTCLLCSSPAQDASTTTTTPLDPRYEGGGQCTNLLARYTTSPYNTLIASLDELTYYTPQASMSPYTVLLQLCIASYAVFIVIDTPQGKGKFGGTVEGPLWGVGD